MAEPAHATLHPIGKTIHESAATLTGKCALLYRHKIAARKAARTPSVYKSLHSHSVGLFLECMLPMRLWVAWAGLIASALAICASPVGRGLLPCAPARKPSQSTVCVLPPAQCPRDGYPTLNRAQREDGP